MPEFVAEDLLRDLVEVFRKRGADRLLTEEVVAALAERLGRPITATRLTRTLKPYGVKPRQFRVGGKPRWGYLLADVAGALPEPPPSPVDSITLASTLAALGSAAGWPVTPRGKSRDAAVVERLVTTAVATSVGIADGPDHPDLASEWVWRIALATARG